MEVEEGIGEINGNEKNKIKKMLKEKKRKREKYFCMKILTIPTFLHLKTVHNTYRFEYFVFEG